YLYSFPTRRSSDLMAFMMAVMKNYGKQYEGSVKVTQAMNSTIVEYINGIEVIKAFNQGKNSYARFSDRVLANAAYFYNWMKSCQLFIQLRSEEYTSELQSRFDLVCRLLLEKKKN